VTALLAKDSCGTRKKLNNHSATVWSKLSYALLGAQNINAKKREKDSIPAQGLQSTEWTLSRKMA
jgi:hypothetical protein